MVAAILALIVAIAPWISAYAQPTAGQRKPLLIEGKTTLYQRVLTRPGAAVSAQPGGAAGKELPPMTLLFVYGKQAAGATNYLEVGSNSEGRVIGFLPEADTIPWKHSLTLAFTNPANRERVLFFKERPGLVDMLNSDKLLVELRADPKADRRRQVAADQPGRLDRARDLRRHAEAVISAADPRRGHDHARSPASRCERCRSPR